MYTISAAILFVAAWFVDKKLKKPKWIWVVPLGMALLGGMCLYASGPGQWVSGIALTVFGWFSSLFAMLFGEYIDPRLIMGVIAGACAVVVIADIIKDHKYNAKARAALAIGPLAAISGGGLVGEWLGIINQTGADTAVQGVSALFGG